MKLWDLGTGKCLHTFTGTSGTVTSVAFSPDGRWAVSGETGSIIRIWDIEKGTLIDMRAASDNISAVGFSADSRWIIAADRSQILIWDITGTDKSFTGRFVGHMKPIKSFALSPDRRWLITGGEDSTVKLWEITLEREKITQPSRSLEGHRGPVTSVALSPDGKWAFSASEDRVIKAWDLATGTCVFTSEEHGEKVNALALSADAKWAITGSSDTKLRLWEIDWEWEMRKSSPRDEGVRPLLENFLYLHTAPEATMPPADREARDDDKLHVLRRRGKASWNEDDFEELKETLENAGYGWLTQGGVKEMLARLAPQIEESLEPPPVPEVPTKPAEEDVEKTIPARASEPEKPDMMKDEKKPWFSRITGLFKKP
jgi:WD40 repeat protein